MGAANSTNSHDMGSGSLRTLLNVTDDEFYRIRVSQCASCGGDVKPGGGTPCDECYLVLFCSAECQQKGDQDKDGVHARCCKKSKPFGPLAEPLLPDGSLAVDVDEPPVFLFPNLLNEFSSPSAKLLGCSLCMYAGDEDPSEELLKSPSYAHPTLLLKGYCRDLDAEPVVVTARAANGRYLTVEEVADAVGEVETRNRGRPESYWFGGIDIHHTFFEGFEKASDGSFQALYGS